LRNALTQANSGNLSAAEMSAIQQGMGEWRQTDSEIARLFLRYLEELAKRGALVDKQQQDPDSKALQAELEANTARQNAVIASMRLAQAKRAF